MEEQLLPGQTLRITIDNNNVLTVSAPAAAGEQQQPQGGGKRKTRKQRKAQEGGAKKKGTRALNPYMVFCAKHRKEAERVAKSKNPQASVTDVAKELGRMYRERKE